MCGICGVLIEDTLPEKDKVYDRFYSAMRKISHRGPDKSITINLKNPINVILDFERLSILDLSTNGDQPFTNEYNSRAVYVICNGEIYNYKEIIKKYNLHPLSTSDCEVIPLLYDFSDYDFIEDIRMMCNMFNSEHAFAILDIDMETGDYKLILSSDRFGIRPLFTAQDNTGFYFASELDGLACTPNAHIERFRPRHFAIITKERGILSNLKYYPYYVLQPEKILYTNVEECKLNIRKLLEEAVITRLQSDQPVGCLLSGGLDSSLVAAIAARELKKSGKVLKTFSIGMPDGTDEKYALMVSKYIGSEHKHIMLTEDDFFNAIPDVVRAIGSYDITTVRASTGQYLISKWISSNTDIKVLLTGDGSDENQGSYKYFLKAPNPEAFHEECIRLLEDIHLYDGLRADRSISRFGMEARFPFLDYKFVEYILRIDPLLRMAKNGVEKWLLRVSFGTDLLPQEILDRSKEAFSDGVSPKEKSLYIMFQERISKLDIEEQKYEHLPPTSKEALYLRKIFCDHYGSNESLAKTIPYYWLPKWSGNITEPSARVLDVYK